jgi:hypothetical protein
MTKITACYEFTAGRLTNRIDRYDRNVSRLSGVLRSLVGGNAIRPHGDDSFAASPFEADRDSVQTKLGRDPVQFVAERADRLGSIWPELPAGTFQDVTVEFHRSAGPVDSHAAESDQHGRHL